MRADNDREEFKLMNTINWQGYIFPHIIEATCMIYYLTVNPIIIHGRVGEFEVALSLRRRSSPSLNILNTGCVMVVPSICFLSISILATPMRMWLMKGEGEGECDSGGEGEGEGE